MKTPRFALFALAAVVFPFVLPSAPAAGIWDGGGANANWGTGANWDDNVVPATGSSVTFGTGFASGTNPINVINGRQIGTLTIDTDTTFRLYGSQQRINTGITRTADSAGVQTLQLWDQWSALITGGPLVWNNYSTDGKLVINSMIRYDNGGSITFNGPGTTEFIGSYGSQSGGSMIVNEGTLLFNKSANVNIFTGTLTIGDGTGTAESAVVRIPEANAFQNLNNNGLIVKQDGLLELSQANNSVIHARMTGGRIDSGTGRLTIANDGNSSITTYASDTSAVIEGRIALSASLNHYISIANGTAADDLVINANIESASSNLRKLGAGTLVLGGNNLFTNPVSVEGGTLIVTANNALGTTTSGTTVSSGATLGFRGGVNYTTAEALTVQGTGVGGIGAIHNFGGNNIFAGNISFPENLTIGAAADSTLILNGNVTDTGALWKSLYKVGDGTVVINGALTVKDFLQVNDGTLVIGSTLTTNRTASVADGATLLVNGTLNPAVALASGATLGGSGTIGGNRVFASGRILSPGNSIGTLTFNANLTMDTGAIYDFEASNGSSYDSVVVGGGLSLGNIVLNLLTDDPVRTEPQDFVLFTFNGAAPTIGDWTVNPSSLWYGTPEVLVVGDTVVLRGMGFIPEPSTLGLLLACAGMALSHRRRRLG